MENATTAITGNMKDLQSSYIELSNITRNVEDNLTRQNNKSMETILELQNVLSKLNNQVYDMSDRISDKTSQAISNSTTELNKGLLMELQNVTGKMEKQLDEISKEFNNVQGQHQKENREILDIMKDTIQSIYKNVEELQTISLVSQ